MNIISRYHKILTILGKGQNGQNSYFKKIKNMPFLIAIRNVSIGEKLKHFIIVYCLLDMFNLYRDVLFEFWNTASICFPARSLL